MKKTEDKCVLMQGEECVTMRWEELCDLRSTGTAIINFEGVVLSKNFAMYAVFSVHPTGKSFKPYNVAVMLAKPSKELRMK